MSSKQEIDKEQWTSWLKSSYVFSKILYSFSFKKRLRIALGMETFPQYRIPDDIKRMSLEEIELKMSELKKPWWDWLFRIMGA